jgi:hypothetical protein
LERYRAWFEEWTPTLESLLEPYGKIVAPLAMRAGEIQERVQYVLCTRILRQAMRHHPEAWAEAPSLLATGHGLSDTLRCLFGHETPPSVAAMALALIAPEREEHGESQGVEIGRQVSGREAERGQLGLPLFVWVVRMVGKGRMTVSVENRTKLKDRAVGLVRVVDAR